MKKLILGPGSAGSGHARGGVVRKHAAAEKAGRGDAAAAGSAVAQRSTHPRPQYRGAAEELFVKHLESLPNVRGVAFSQVHSVNSGESRKCRPTNMESVKSPSLCSSPSSATECTLLLSAGLVRGLTRSVSTRLAGQCTSPADCSMSMIGGLPRCSPCGGKARRRGTRPQPSQPTQPPGSRHQSLARCGRPTRVTASGCHSIPGGSCCGRIRSVAPSRLAISWPLSAKPAVVGLLPCSGL
jgi:hypothetical protein